MNPIEKVSAESLGGWGAIPTVERSLVTAISTPTTSPSQATGEQSDKSSAQATVAAKSLPPPPPQNACVNPDNSLSMAFYMWLIQLQRRVGGYIAAPADDEQILAYEPEIVDRMARQVAESVQAEVFAQRRLPSLSEIDMWGRGVIRQIVEELLWEAESRAGDSRKLGGKLPSYYLSTATFNAFTGSTNIVTLGTIAAGIWQGTAIADGYIASAATWNGKQAALGFTPINKAGDTAVGTLDLGSGKLYKVNGVQVLTAQQTGMGATLAANTLSGTYSTDKAALQNAYNKVISLETKLKTHGLLAT